VGSSRNRAPADRPERPERPPSSRSGPSAAPARPPRPSAVDGGTSHVHPSTTVSAPFRFCSGRAGEPKPSVRADDKPAREDPLDRLLLGPWSRYFTQKLEQDVLQSVAATGDEAAAAFLANCGSSDARGARILGPRSAGSADPWEATACFGSAAWPPFRAPFLPDQHGPEDQSVGPGRRNAVLRPMPNGQSGQSFSPSETGGDSLAFRGTGESVALFPEAVVTVSQPPDEPGGGAGALGRAASQTPVFRITDLTNANRPASSSRSGDNSSSAPTSSVGGGSGAAGGTASTNSSGGVSGGSGVSGAPTVSQSSASSYSVSFTSGTSGRARGSCTTGTTSVTADTTSPGTSCGLDSVLGALAASDGLEAFCGGMSPAMSATLDEVLLGGTRVGGGANFGGMNSSTFAGGVSSTGLRPFGGSDALYKCSSAAFRSSNLSKTSSRDRGNAITSGALGPSGELGAHPASGELRSRIRQLELDFVRERAMKQSLAAAVKQLDAGGCLLEKRLERGGRNTLTNLGNLCFMNAGIQCLSHLEPVMSFFLSGKYLESLNTGPDNFLGSGAECTVTVGFGDVLGKLWCAPEVLLERSSSAGAGAAAGAVAGGAGGTRGSRCTKSPHSSPRSSRRGSKTSDEKARVEVKPPLLGLDPAEVKLAQRHAEWVNLRTGGTVYPLAEGGHGVFVERRLSARSARSARSSVEADDDGRGGREGKKRERSSSSDLELVRPEDHAKYEKEAALLTQSSFVLQAAVKKLELEVALRRASADFGEGIATIGRTVTIGPESGGSTLNISSPHGTRSARSSARLSSPSARSSVRSGRLGDELNVARPGSSNPSPRISETSSVNGPLLGGAPITSRGVTTAALERATKEYEKFKAENPRPGLLHMSTPAPDPATVAARERREAERERRKAERERAAAAVREQNVQKEGEEAGEQKVQKKAADAEEEKGGAEENNKELNKGPGEDAARTRETGSPHSSEKVPQRGILKSGGGEPEKHAEKRAEKRASSAQRQFSPTTAGTAPPSAERTPCSARSEESAPSGTESILQIASIPGRCRIITAPKCRATAPTGVAQQGFSEGSDSARTEEKNTSKTVAFGGTSFSAVRKAASMSFPAASAVSAPSGGSSQLEHASVSLGTRAQMTPPQSGGIEPTSSRGGGYRESPKATSSRERRGQRIAGESGSPTLVGSLWKSVAEAVTTGRLAALAPDFSNLAMGPGSSASSRTSGGSPGGSGTSNRSRGSSTPAQPITQTLWDQLLETFTPASASSPSPPPGRRSTKRGLPRAAAAVGFREDDIPVAERQEKWLSPRGTRMSSSPSEGDAHGVSAECRHSSRHSLRDQTNLTINEFDTPSSVGANPGRKDTTGAKKKPSSVEYVPKKFRAQLATANEFLFARKRSRQEQQDAQEFINWLLDMWQEDLNVARKTVTLPDGRKVEPPAKCKLELRAEDLAMYTFLILHAVVFNSLFNVFAGSLATPSPFLQVTISSITKL